MAVEDRHEEYLQWSERWRRCRDFIDGEDAVKRGGMRYLPKLAGHDADAYEGYKKRAGFFGAAWRTVQLMLGSAFQRDPVVEGSDALKKLAADIDLEGTSLEGFALQVVREQLTTGRVAVLPDFAEGLNRPYLALYTAESITNWHVERAPDGERFLRFVVLREMGRKPKANDPYDYENQERYRVLELVGDPADAIYRQRVFVKPDPTLHRATTSFVEEDDPRVPTMRGVPFRRIPLRIIGAVDLTPAVDRPPLLSLVNANLHHYMVSADHDHALHWASLPTPYVTGLGPKDEAGPFVVGANRAWVLPSEASAGYLEVKGSGFAAQADRLEQLEKHMQALGSRLLREEKKGVEAQGTVFMRQSGDDATLKQILQTANRGLEQVLATFSAWANPFADPLTVEITTDLADAQFAVADVAEATAAFEKSLIGWQELVDVMKRAGMVAPETDAEELRQRIATEPAPRKTAGAV